MASTHKACHCCGQIHRLPALGPGQVAVCTRCGSDLHDPEGSRRANARTAAAALASLVLFFPAVFLPILEVERLGHRSASSIIGGIIDLLGHGSFFVGGVVLLFSIVFPLAKIVLLLELSLAGMLHRRHKALTYRIMEHAGKWSMMDVLLLAFLVMLVKLGDLVAFDFGWGVLAFTLCVASSLLASLSFDPHAIWEDEEQPS